MAGHTRKQPRGITFKGTTWIKATDSARATQRGNLYRCFTNPPNGQPVLFMNDHPLTGGYPVLAAVATHDLNKVAQIPPGAFIQFRQFTHVLDLDAE